MGDSELDPAPECAIRLKDVEFRYRRSQLEDFSLSLPQFVLDAREDVLLVGPSGSGKSTLLNLICGTLSPVSGRVEILGQDLAALSGSQRDRFRARSIGVIFQQFNLVPYLTTLENILLPFTLARSQLPDAEDRAISLMTALGLEKGLANRRASTLSVGQQQRAAAARAFLMRPGLIIADEPTAALDTGRREAFLSVLFKQARETGAAILIVSHDRALDRHFSRTVELESLLGRRRSFAA